MNTEKLTLETLATAAQQGKREVLSLLWEKTERLIKKLILKTINKRILPTHIEESDVLQCGYFALLAAVRAFKNSGLKFTSYLSYSVQNAVNECIYGRSRRKSKFKEVSYNQTVTDKSGDDVEMLELINDPVTLDELVSSVMYGLGIRFGNETRNAYLKTTISSRVKYLVETGRLRRIEEDGVIRYGKVQRSIYGE